MLLQVPVLFSDVVRRSEEPATVAHPRASRAPSSVGPAGPRRINPFLAAVAPSAAGVARCTPAHRTSSAATTPRRTCGQRTIGRRRGLSPPPSTWMRPAWATWGWTSRW